MHISKAGGLIAAAGPEATRPKLLPGSLTAVDHIAQTFQQAGLFPIVVVTGFEAEEVKYRLAGQGIVFLHNKDYLETEMFESVRMGLDFLRDKCERIVFTPSIVPLFLPDTLHRLLQEKNSIVSPVCQENDGHPVVLSSAIVPQILAYQGDWGLRGALKEMDAVRTYVQVDDEGILITSNESDKLKAHFDERSSEFVQPIVRLGMERESELFNDRTKLLLLLVGVTGSVLGASDMMAMSLSYAWNILNRLETALGYKVIIRRRGGRAGSGSTLTPKGIAFLKAFQKYEEEVLEKSKESFRELLRDKGLLEP